MATAYDEDYADEYARVLKSTGNEAYARKRAFAIAEGWEWGGEPEYD